MSICLSQLPPCSSSPLNPPQCNFQLPQHGKVWDLRNLGNEATLLIPDPTFNGPSNDTGDSRTCITLFNRLFLFVKPDEVCFHMHVGLLGVPGPCAQVHERPNQIPKQLILLSEYLQCEVLPRLMLNGTSPDQGEPDIGGERDVLTEACVPEHDRSSPIDSAIHLVVDHHSSKVGVDPVGHD